MVVLIGRTCAALLAGPLAPPHLKASANHKRRVPYGHISASQSVGKITRDVCHMFISPHLKASANHKRRVPSLHISACQSVGESQETCAICSYLRMSERRRITRDVCHIFISPHVRASANHKRRVPYLHICGSVRETARASAA
eukprot:4377011-Pleurochrysis_carterae.AAC.1